MSLNYTSFVTSLANELVVPVNDANFQIEIPNIIDYAEQRIYRELDLLNTIVRDSSSSLSAGTRTFNLPTSLGTFVVTEDINVVTPAGTANPDSGTRNPLIPASKEMLDFLYPSSTGSGVPQYFGMVTQNQIIVGPWPDQAYQVEVVGTQRPSPLSSSNATTLLSVYFPDLFLMAACVKGSAYLKNFGGVVDDPKMAVTFEAQYGSLKQSADVEENRKKFASQGWSSKEPAPLATPPRT